MYFYIQLAVPERISQLENLTSETALLGSTEIAASVNVLLPVTTAVAGNQTVLHNSVYDYCPCV